MASFYVNKTKRHWRIIEEKWENGSRTKKQVPQKAYEAFGISNTMTLDQVKTRIKEINSKNKIERLKASEAARRVNLSSVIESIYIPEALATQFITQLKENSFGSEKHTEKLLSHFQFIQRMLTTLQIEPNQYYEKKELIYKYFLNKSTSLDYTNKILRILNTWGTFVCKHRGQFYEPVLKPRGTVREKINDTYTDSDNYQGPSEPLGPRLLEQKKHELTVSGNYEWLFISVWFGLRPNEIESCRNPKNYRIEHGKKKVLWIYQSKLTSIPRDKRWKGIPILYPEQEQALEYIINVNFKKPLVKIVKRVFGERFRLYAGRKNFQDMMLDLHHSLEDISMWMGHQNINTTWTRYRNRQRVGGS